MSPLLKRIFIYLWNTLLLGFSLFAALVILPKLPDMFRHPMTPELDVLGYLGVALVIASWICAASLASPFWFRVPA